MKIQECFEKTFKDYKVSLKDLEEVANKLEVGQVDALEESNLNKKPKATNLMRGLRRKL